MSSVTFINKQNDRYSFSRESISSISVEDSFGNTAYKTDLSDSFFTTFLDTSFNTTINSGLMPPGVRAIYPGIIVFERPPRMQMVQYISMSVDEICEYEDEQDDYPETDMYYIPIPWQIYIVSYSFTSGRPLTNSVKMFFSKEPLTNPDVQLHLPYIPNFFTNGSLCPPHFADSDEIYRYPADISGVIASAYDWVWNTGFNQDLTDGVKTNMLGFINNPVVNYVNQNSSSIHRFYSKLSEYTPEQIVSYDWASPSYTTYYDTSSEIRYLYSLEKLQNKYIEENDIDFDDIEDFESYVDVEEFSHWIDSVYSIKKTYSDIMNSILFDRNNNSENNSNHRFSFEHAHKLVPNESNFVTYMLNYVNQLST